MPGGVLEGGCCLRMFPEGLVSWETNGRAAPPLVVAAESSARGGVGGVGVFFFGMGGLIGHQAHCPEKNQLLISLIMSPAGLVSGGTNGRAPPPTVVAAEYAVSRMLG